MAFKKAVDQKHPRQRPGTYRRQTFNLEIVRETSGPLQKQTADTASEQVTGDLPTVSSLRRRKGSRGEGVCSEFG